MGAWACSVYGPEGKYLHPRWRWTRRAALILLTGMTGISVHHVSSDAGAEFYFIDMLLPRAGRRASSPSSTLN